MPLVKSLNNHPYRNRMYARGDVYEVPDGDVRLLVDLKRVELVKDKSARATYQTRDMQAGITGTRGTVSMSSEQSSEQVANEVGKFEPSRAPRKTANKPADAQ